jgi:hypothetical protein
MKAKTFKGNSTEEIKAALSKSLTDGYKPTLAIVFLSIKQNHIEICDLLHNEGISIFGCTTAGEFIDSEISEGGITIMLLDLDPAMFKVVLLESGEDSVYEVSKQIGSSGKESFQNPAFIISSGWLQTDGELIIKGIEEGADSKPSIFGGMAGDDLQLSGPFVFTHGQKGKGVTAVIAIIVDADRIEVNGIATCGWKAVGIAKTITKSEFNIIYTIDDQPALDVVMKYLGIDLDSQPITNTVFNLGAYYPLQLEREGAPPVMRTAMLGNAEDHSLICAGPIPQGSKVRFSLPPDFDIIDTVVNECEGIQTNGENSADAVIMFSCVSRYLSFGVMTSEEIERVKNVWNAPFIGFFSYGEYGKAKDSKHEFHNNTCCVLVLKEK